MQLTKLGALLRGGLAVVVLGAATSAQALMLSVSPAVQNAMPGDSVSVDIVASGLGDGVAPSIGDFDLDIFYDPAALSFVDYTLGSGLGDIFLAEAIDFSLGDDGAGTVGLNELSLLEADDVSCIFCIPPYLDDIQGASLVLATLEFMVDVLDEGDFTDIGFGSIYAIGDGFGRPLTPSSTRSGRVQNPSTQIPLPATALLFMVGLAAMRTQRRKG